MTKPGIRILVALTASTALIILNILAVTSGEAELFYEQISYLIE